MDIQKSMDGMSAQWREDRSKYHLTLGKLIDTLEEPDKSGMPVKFSSGGTPVQPHSYRGYYVDLAFDSSDRPAVMASEFLAELKGNVLDKEFEGWKGGDFTMDRNTPLWVAEHGVSTNLAIIDVQNCDGFILLITKQLD